MAFVLLRQSSPTLPHALVRVVLAARLAGIPEATRLEFAHKPNPLELVVNCVKPRQYRWYDFIVWRDNLSVGVDK